MANPVQPATTATVPIAPHGRATPFSPPTFGTAIPGPGAMTRSQWTRLSQTLTTLRSARLQNPVAQKNAIAQFLKTHGVTQPLPSALDAVGIMGHPNDFSDDTLLLWRGGQKLKAALNMAILTQYEVDAPLSYFVRGIILAGDLSLLPALEMIAGHHSARHEGNQAARILSSPFPWFLMQREEALSQAIQPLHFFTFIARNLDFWKRKHDMASLAHLVVMIQSESHLHARPVLERIEMHRDARDIPLLERIAARFPNFSEGKEAVQLLRRMPQNPERTAATRRKIADLRSYLLQNNDTLTRFLEDPLTEYLRVYEGIAPGSPEQELFAALEAAFDPYTYNLGKFVGLHPQTRDIRDQLPASGSLDDKALILEVGKMILRQLQSAEGGVTNAFLDDIVLYREGWRHFDHPRAEGLQYRQWLQLLRGIDNESGFDVMVRILKAQELVGAEERLYARFPSRESFYQKLALALTLKPNLKHFFLWEIQESFPRLAEKMRALFFPAAPSSSSKKSKPPG